MAGPKIPELLWENAAYLTQLKDSYSGDQDPDKLRGVVSMHAEALRRCREQDTDVRDTIRELTSQVQTARANLEAAEAHGSVEELVAAMEQELQKKQRNVTSMKDEERALQAQLRALTSELETTRSLNKQRQNETREAIHRCRHEMSLYAHISRTTFDEVSDSAVAGSVSNLDGHDIREFSLPRLAGPSQADHVAHVDRMWDLIS